MNRRIAREAAWVLLGQVGTALGSAAGLKLLTQLVPKEIYGRLILLEVAMVLPGWLFFSPFLQAAIRLYAPSRESGTLSPLFRTIVLIYAWANLLALAAGILLIQSGLLKGTNFPPMALLLTLAVFLVNTWQLLGLGVLGAARLRRRAAGLSVLNTWARPLCATAAVLLFTPSLSAVLAGYLAASAVTLPFALEPVRLALRERAAPWFRRDLFNKLLVYGAPYAIWSVFSWGENYAERYALQLVLGAAAVGPYAAAIQVASMPFNFICAFFAQLANPIVFERAGFGAEPARLAAGRAVVASSAALFVASGIVIAAGFAFAGTWVMRLFTHADYLVPKGILMILVGGAFAQNLAQLLTVSALAHNRTDALLWAVAIPGTLSVPLSLLLVRQGGTWGAAWSNALTSLLFLTLIGWVSRTLAGRPGGSLSTAASQKQ